MTATQTLAAAWGHGPGKSVTVEIDRPPAAEPRRPGRPLTDVAAGPFAARVAQVLTTALAPRRYEPWAQHNDHRAYPSARAAHAHDVALRAGPRGWLYDPVRGELVGAGPGRLVDPHSFVIAVCPQPSRLPRSYGDLRNALALLEVGHVGAALAEAAAAAGLSACVRLLADAGLEITLRPAPDGRARWPRHRVQAYRSSGVGPRGLSPDPRPLPHASYARFVAAALQAPDGSPAHGAGLAHRLAVHNVAGLADGSYRAADGTARLRARGAVTEALQDAYTIGAGEVDVAGMNVCWALTADVAAAVRKHGPAGYPQLLLSAGAAAQHVATAAAAAGLFCRPVRSVAEPVAEAALGVPAGEDLLYLLLVGVPRVRGFGYDLDPPRGRP